MMYVTVIFYCLITVSFYTIICLCIFLRAFVFVFSSSCTQLLYFEKMLQKMAVLPLIHQNQGENIKWLHEIHWWEIREARESKEDKYLRLDKKYNRYILLLH